VGTFGTETVGFTICDFVDVRLLASELSSFDLVVLLCGFVFFLASCIGP
jgi:hypothetical protein